MQRAKTGSAEATKQELELKRKICVDAAAFASPSILARTRRKTTFIPSLKTVSMLAFMSQTYQYFAVRKRTDTPTLRNPLKQRLGLSPPITSMWSINKDT